MQTLILLALPAVLLAAGPKFYGGYPPYGGPGYNPLFFNDNFVCDLDASVLLVVDSQAAPTKRHHRHHFQPFNFNPSNALRVKCSEIANYNEDSCNICCQQTARRDVSLANQKLFGFLTVINTPAHSGPAPVPESDDLTARKKRAANDDTFNVDFVPLPVAPWVPKKLHSNVKCVCCAPKAAPVAPQPVTYGAATAANDVANTAYGTATVVNTPTPIVASAPASPPATQY